VPQGARPNRRLHSATIPSGRFGFESTISPFLLPTAEPPLVNSHKLSRELARTLLASAGQAPRRRSSDLRATFARI
jgi:hypothetical protein